MLIQTHASSWRIVRIQNQANPYYPYEVGCLVRLYKDFVAITQRDSQCVHGISKRLAGPGIRSRAGPSVAENPTVTRVHVRAGPPGTPGSGLPVGPCTAAALPARRDLRHASTISGTIPTPFSAVTPAATWTPLSGFSPK